MLLTRCFIGASTSVDTHASRSDRPYGIGSLPRAGTSRLTTLGRSTTGKSNSERSESLTVANTG